VKRLPPNRYRTNEQPDSDGIVRQRDNGVAVMSQREAAKQLGMHPGTVANIERRALRKVREALENFAPC